MRRRVIKQVTTGSFIVIQPVIRSADGVNRMGVWRWELRSFREMGATFLEAEGFTYTKWGARLEGRLARRKLGRNLLRMESPLVTIYDEVE